jgi:signal transduction histidine kinase
MGVWDRSKPVANDVMETVASTLRTPSAQGSETPPAGAPHAWRMRFRLRSTLVAAMLAAVALVGIIAYVQQEEDAAAALEDFGAGQTLVARSLALAIRADDRGSGPAALATRLLQGLGHPAGLTVLVRPPGGHVFTRPNGTQIEVPELDAALAEDASEARLLAPAAQRLGLPARLAIAGIAQDGPEGGWVVATVATAARERDRQRRAPARLIQSVLLAAGLVGAFGGLAMRAQRKELGLERELALSALRRERDARLERLRRVATLGTLSMGVAHEIATPLGVIALRAEQLGHAFGSDDRARRGAEVIQEQCETIRQIVRGLLTLARGGAPAMAMVSADTLTREAVDLCEHRFANARVSLERRLQDGLPSVQGDRRLIVQALVNLLLNACDACRAGGHVAIEVTSKSGSVRFAVIDDGVGIPPEAARRMSEPLLTTKPEGEGTGLGLAIVAEIVKSHRGQFDISARDSGGTVADIVLPVAGAVQGETS